jgi:hypothetical protein
MCLLYVCVIRHGPNQYPSCALTWTRTSLVQCTPRGFRLGVDCFAYITFNVQQVLGAHLERVWKFEQTFQIGSLGTNSFWRLLACQNEFGPKCTDMECPSLNPSHQLQACAKTYETWKVSYAEQPTSSKNSD